MVPLFDEERVFPELLRRVPNRDIPDLTFRRRVVEAVIVLDLSNEDSEERLTFQV